MGKLRGLRMYVIEIEILDTSYGHEVGDIVFGVVESNGLNNAARKFENRCCGSEYPNYKIKAIHEVYGMFNPIGR